MLTNLKKALTSKVNAMVENVALQYLTTPKPTAKPKRFQFVLAFVRDTALRLAALSQPSNSMQAAIKKEQTMLN